MSKDHDSAELCLSHFSREPVNVVRSVEQRIADPSYRSCYDKPRGLWVSVDGEDDWAAWCASENFGIGPLRHRVRLADDHNVLVIADALDLMCFREKWGRIEPYGSCPRPYIPWELVAAEYQGIIIAPYQWSCRMNENWYYGWDCASGCIWDAAAVASIELLTEREAA